MKKKIIQALFLIATCLSTAALAAPTQLTLTVFFIRHGQSCANVAPRFDLAINYLDPPLSDCGLYRSLQTGEIFKKYLADHNISLDFKASSTLMRAKETLLMMAYDDFFVKNETLFELPYISESPFGNITTVPQNTPEIIRSQRQKISTIFPGIQPAQISVEYTANIDRKLGDYELFLEQTLPKIATKLSASNPKENYYAAVVSHSLVMSNSIGCIGGSDGIPANNEIFKVQYILQSNARGLHLIKKSKCVRVISIDRDDTIEPKDRKRCIYSKNDAAVPLSAHALSLPKGTAEREEWIRLKLSSVCKNK